MVAQMPGGPEFLAVPKELVDATKETPVEGWMNRFYNLYEVGRKKGAPSSYIDYFKARTFMFEELAEERQRGREEILDALIWCSGSQDFQEGGIAREGWLKLCAPLLEATKSPRESGVANETEWDARKRLGEKPFDKDPASGGEGE